MTQAMHRILIVEDDQDIRSVLRAILSAGGYRLTEAEGVARGDIEARSGKPDLLIVDLGLPDGDGLTLIRQVRGWSRVPIIVLSARTQEDQKLAAFEAGADDYVTKPFSAPELLARVHAVFRRSVYVTEQGAPLQLGEIQVDLVRREVSSPEGKVHLTPLEFRIMESLARHAGLIVTHQHLIRDVWGPAETEGTRNLRVYIKALRAKLEPDPQRPRYLLTEAGIGYRLSR